MHYIISNLYNFTNVKTYLFLFSFFLLKKPQLEKLKITQKKIQLKTFKNSSTRDNFLKNMFSF